MLVRAAPRDVNPYAQDFQLHPGLNKKFLLCLGSAARDSKAHVIITEMSELAKGHCQLCPMSDTLICQLNSSSLPLRVGQPSDS